MSMKALGELFIFVCRSKISPIIFSKQLAVVRNCIISYDLLKFFEKKKQLKINEQKRKKKTLKSK